MTVLESTLLDLYENGQYEMAESLRAVESQMFELGESVNADTVYFFQTCPTMESVNYGEIDKANKEVKECMKLLKDANDYDGDIKSRERMMKFSNICRKIEQILSAILIIQTVSGVVRNVRGAASAKSDIRYYRDGQIKINRNSVVEDSSFKNPARAESSQKALVSSVSYLIIGVVTGVVGVIIAKKTVNETYEADLKMLKDLKPKIEKTAKSIRNDADREKLMKAAAAIDKAIEKANA